LCFSAQKRQYKEETQQYKTLFLPCPFAQFHILCIAKPYAHTAQPQITAKTADIVSGFYYERKRIATGGTAARRYFLASS